MLFTIYLTQISMDLLSFFFIRCKLICSIQHQFYIYSVPLCCCCILELPPCPRTIKFYLLYILPNSQWIFPVFFYWMQIDILYPTLSSYLQCALSLLQYLRITYYLLYVDVFVHNCNKLCTSFVSKSELATSS